MHMSYCPFHLISTGHEHFPGMCKTSWLQYGQLVHTFLVYDGFTWRGKLNSQYIPAVSPNIWTSFSKLPLLVSANSPATLQMCREHSQTTHHDSIGWYGPIVIYHSFHIQQNIIGKKNLLKTQNLYKTVHLAISCTVVVPSIHIYSDWVTIQRAAQF